MTSEKENTYVSQGGETLPTGDIREDEASGMFFLHIDADNPNHPLEKKAIMWSRNPVRVKQ